MKIMRLSLITAVVLFCASLLPAPSVLSQPAVPVLGPGIVGAQADDPTAPSQPVKLIFIHHSTGQNWLDDYHGQLGIELRDNNYFVSDTNYGWGPGGIGSSTDIGNWYQWFGGGRDGTVLGALYAESGQNSSYSRLATDPGGENEIIMFKSCFPNSALKGNAGDSIPPIASNPLREQDAYSAYHTVANAKGIYLDLLAYFQSKPDKLFIAIAAPPLIDGTYAANARAFNQWLVDKTNGWLKDYPLNNVAVFDFYNVLTTNGGDADTNDLDWTTGNHHRWWLGAVQHQYSVAQNTLAYPTSDDHPSAAGSYKASKEFVPLLNVFYHRWKTGVAPAAVSNLRLTSAITTTGQLTTTLVWTPPLGALTATVRYSSTLITQANWSGATLLADSLPGGTAAYTPTVPYSGGIVFFAVGSQNTVGWSAPSNNVFWPYRCVLLPVVQK
jgi:hypothetical protein